MPLLGSLLVAKKEAKRLEKLAKAAVKAVNPAQTGAPSARKEKKEKEKEAKAAAAPVEAWVNTTLLERRRVRISAIHGCSRESR